jgi:hypothetical protein
VIDFYAIQTLFLAFSIFPISIFAFMGIESSILSSKENHLRFYNWWFTEQEKRPKKDFERLLSGSYSEKITRAICDPERKYFTRKLKILNSGLLIRLVGFTLFLMSVLICLRILYTLPMPS